MTTDATARVELRALRRAVTAHMRSDAARQIQDFGDAATEVLLWLRHFEVVNDGRGARELLDGTRAAIVEAAALVGLGLCRPALGAIRQQSELLIGYSYFYSHPEEWDRVKRTGDGFMLLSQIVKHHTEIDPTLRDRLQMLRDRDETDIQKEYRFLSAHIHGQSPLTVPRSERLSEICSTVDVLEETVDAQRRTARALSNYFTALYAAHWPDLPALSVRRVSSALTGKQRSRFFAASLASP